MIEAIKKRLRAPSSPILEDHQDTLNEFSIILMVLGALALLRLFFVSDTQVVSTIISGILLLAGANFARRLSDLNFQLAWSVMVVAVIAAIALEALGFSDGIARFIYPIAILVSSLLVTRTGIVIFTVLAAGAHILVANVLGYPWTNSEQMTGPLLLILITAVASFLASRQLRSSLETAEQFSAKTSDMLEQIRTQRAELTKTVKALGEANARLERLNIELDQARRAAEEADRFKSEFLAHMSHELRTPLNAILNFTAFVSDGLMGDVNPEQVETLQKVIDSGNHLLSLINDVLDISKIEAGMMSLFIEEVDLNAALNSTISIAKGLVKDKPIELITEVEENLPHINGDRRRIRQIFLNLISNAVKFTPKGSVTLRSSLSEGSILVSVADTGIGVSQEDIDTIFEPFKQAKHELRNVIGTGLGLPICKHFVEAHGGRIWAESQLGAGSIFYVSLPVSYLQLDGQPIAAPAQPLANQG